MTPRRKSHEKAKVSHKSAQNKRNVAKKLKELYFQDGITCTRAGIIAGCGAEYVSKMFKVFGEEIAKHNEIDETWMEKNDRVRDRALEGLSMQLVKSDERINGHKLHLEAVREVHVNLLPNLAEKLLDTPLGAAIKRLDVKTAFAIYTMLGDGINMYKNYGYYIETIRNNIRAETILNLEVQQQYDIMEIMPPPSQVLNAEIERRIAEKQGLTQPTLDQKK